MVVMDPSPCEQTERTLAWLYGELPEAEEGVQLAHVAGCSACSALVETHESVAALVATGRPGVRGVQVEPPVASTPEAPVQSGRSWRVVAMAAGVLLAAAALLSMGNGLFPSDGPPPPVAVAPLPVPEVEPVAALGEPAVFAAPLDSDLDALDEDVDALFADLDLETL
jgi:hypothetical protein